MSPIIRSGVSGGSKGRSNDRVRISKEAVENKSHVSLSSEEHPINKSGDIARDPNIRNAQDLLKSNLSKDFKAPTLAPKIEASPEPAKPVNAKPFGLGVKPKMTLSTKPNMALKKSDDAPMVGTENAQYEVSQISSNVKPKTAQVQEISTIISKSPPPKNDSLPGGINLDFLMGGDTPAVAKPAKVLEEQEVLEEKKKIMESSHNDLDKVSLAPTHKKPNMGMSNSNSNANIKKPPIDIFNSNNKNGGKTKMDDSKPIANLTESKPNKSAVVRDFSNENSDNDDIFSRAQTKKRVGNGGVRKPDPKKDAEVDDMFGLGSSSKPKPKSKDHNKSAFDVDDGPDDDYWGDLLESKPKKVDPRGKSKPKPPSPPAQKDDDWGDLDDDPFGGPPRKSKPKKNTDLQPISDVQTFDNEPQDSGFAINLNINKGKINLIGVNKSRDNSIGINIGRHGGNAKGGGMKMGGDLGISGVGMRDVEEIQESRGGEGLGKGKGGILGMDLGDGWGGDGDDAPLPTVTKKVERKKVERVEEKKVGKKVDNGELDMDDDWF